MESSVGANVLAVTSIVVCGHGPGLWWTQNYDTFGALIDASADRHFNRGIAW
jgi:hypothetical protein